MDDGEGSECRFAPLLYASSSFFSLSPFGRKTASWPDMRRPSARSSLAPSANLLISSVFWSLRAYRCWTRRLSSRRSKPAFHVLMSCDLRSPAVEEATERCEGAIEGVRVGAALYEDMRVEARLPLVCDFFSLDCACCDMVTDIAVVGVLVVLRQRWRRCVRGVRRAGGKKEGTKECTSIIKHTVQALGEHRPRAGDV